MGFLDIFKKKSELKAEKINIDELDSFLKTRKEKIKSQEDNFHSIARAKILQLTKDIDEKIIILDKIDLKNKKAEEKIKLLNKENLNYYIIHLKRVIEKLNELDKNDSKYIEKINNVFSDFEKRSSLNYEKATLLIGKELEVVRDLLGNFIRGLKDLVKENKSYLENSVIVYSIDDKLNDLNDSKKTKSEINENLDKVKQNILKTKLQINSSEKDIKNIKKSEEYSSEKNNIQIIESKKQEIKKEIYELMSIIDFKSLSNIFHSNEKKMNTIKEYNNNFLESFEKDNGEKIISLMNEANMDKQKQEEKISQIINLKQELNSIFSINSEHKKIKDIEDNLQKLNIKLQELNAEESREIKRIEKIDEKIKEIINSLKNELIKLDIELI